VDEILNTPKEPVEKNKPAKSSLSRLVKNSAHIKKLFSTSAALKKIRFNELNLLKEIREFVDANPDMYENISDPSTFRRQIRADVLPRFIDNEFIQTTQRNLLGEFLKSTNHQKDQDALITALVFLQSHMDLGVPCEDNPLWEIIFNLSIKDGIKFVDSLTALIEGLDTIRDKEPDLISRDPMILGYTKEVSQWNIYWRQLIERENIKVHESLISAMLRGELVIELYFDEIIHVPLFLFRLFKRKKMNEAADLSNMVDDDRTVLAREVFEQINAALALDFALLKPVLIKRLEETREKSDKNGNPDQSKALTDVIRALAKSPEAPGNPFLLALVMTKLSNQKYWDNKRDFLFFMTVLKDPEKPQHYHTYSRILDRLKCIDTSEGVLKCAIEIKEDDFWGYWGLGTHYLKQNELDKSETQLNEALKIAQQLEIYSKKSFTRELFLIKEDILKLNKKKIKEEAKTHQQIDLF
jgi:hypothetical protein